MNKKGFTLIELLAVVILIAIIIAIVFPKISIILNQSKDTVNDVQVKRILDAAYDYTLKNVEILPNNGDTIYLTLNELKKERLIDAVIKESATKKSFSEDLVISIKNIGTGYTKVGENSKLNGNYLYTVEFAFMNTFEFESRKPVITFGGYDANPIVMNLNLGEKYIEPIYTAYSYEGEDITSKVIKNIIYNSQNSDNIDTSVAGIYYVNYSVVDKNGYSNYATINVIIVDNEKPNLIIPENLTINSDVNKYDLLEGASCTDNSGVCDITFTGKIDFGVAGKYIIEYSAVDPSGNTTTLKRVITVK